MTVPEYSPTLAPLVTDAAIEERVAQLIGRASSSQLWLLFLDADAVQLPLVLPIHSLPTEPSDEISARIAATTREMMHDTDAIGAPAGVLAAAAAILVWERYASSRLTARDSAWLSSLAVAFSAAGVPVRATMLSHREGVTLLPAWYADAALVGEVSAREAGYERGTGDQAVHDDAADADDHASEPHQEQRQG